MVYAVIDTNIIVSSFIDNITLSLYILLMFKITGDKVTSSLSNHQIRFWTLTCCHKHNILIIACKYKSF